LPKEPIPGINHIYLTRYIYFKYPYRLN
jgi:hypothetical protein